MFDEEAGFVRDVLKTQREESLYELGVEVLETDAAGDGGVDEIFLPAWRSIRNFSDEGEGGDTTTSGDDSRTSNAISPVRMLKRDSSTQQSTIELGLEIAEQFEEEKLFAEHSWRSSSANRKVDPDVLIEETTVRHDDETPVTTHRSTSVSSRYDESTSTSAGGECLPSIPLPELGSRDRQHPVTSALQGQVSEQSWLTPSVAKTDEKKETSSPTEESLMQESGAHPSKDSRLLRHEIWDSKAGTTAIAAAAEGRSGSQSAETANSGGETAGQVTALDEDWTLSSGGESESSNEDNDQRPRVVEGAKSSDGEDFGFEVIEP